MSDGVSKIARLLNSISEIGIVTLMLLVVLNVILRVFNMPIKGTYDFVGFIAVIISSFSIAFCEVKDGHISINLLTDRLPLKVQRVIAIIITTISTVFMAVVSWSAVKHALFLKAKNNTSMTTLTPLYPFVFIISIGVFILCLVLLSKLIASIRRKDVIIK